MPKKRIRVTRSGSEVIHSAKQHLDAIPAQAPAGAHELRALVLTLVSVSRDLRELAMINARPLLPFNNASERILGYLRLFVGKEVSREELEVVSGISEYGRRIREWRVEFGWPITHKANSYLLQRDEPDENKAELWRTVNSIRRSGQSARDRMLALFRALPVGTIVTTAQLRYVTEGVDMRRVRELRTQLGWRIMTKKTGMPQLKPGEYVLVDPEPLEEHDRDIKEETVITVLTRDRQRCRKCGWHPSERIPGDPRQYIELHHITWHVGGGSNEADNLLTLCNVHHKHVHALRLGADKLTGWLAEAN